jgi:hypothetical protein
MLLICSCNREGSTLSDYRALAKELKVNSSNYTAEEWDDAVRKYEKLEKAVEQCHFSNKEKKELNRLRGQCAAYMLKSITKQTKLHMEDAMEQFSDMAEGFNEALGEKGIDGLFDDEEE